MTATETSPSKKGFFSRYPRWTYWFAALLLVELIVVLSVVYGYIMPKKQKLKDSVSDCGFHYAREIEYCDSNQKSAIRYCIKGCNTNDLQCINNCYTKNENYSARCTPDVLRAYDWCVINSVDYWY